MQARLRPPPSALRVDRQRPWGSDGALFVGRCGLRVCRARFRSAAPSGHEQKLSAFAESRKSKAPVENEDNGGKFNLDQPLPTLCPPVSSGFESAASQASRVRRAMSIAILRSES